MGGKSKNKKGKNSQGFARLLGKLWKSHGRDMASSAVDQYGTKGATALENRLREKGGKHETRGADMIARYRDPALDVASARLAQRNNHGNAPYYQQHMAPQRPSTTPVPSTTTYGGGQYRR